MPAAPREGHAGYLLGILLLMFVLVPALRHEALDDTVFGDPRHTLGHWALKIVVLVVLLVAALTVAQPRRRWPTILFLVGVPTVLEAASGAVIGQPLEGEIAAVRSTYIGLAMLYVVWRGLKGLFSRQVVTGDTIATAICAYILIGLAWADLYSALQHIAPGAFGETTRSTAETFYFSFVTLTTLGYGDMVPKTDVARSLAIIEAIVGQMFVAVVLARLVGLYFKGDAPGDTPGDTDAAE